MKRFQLLTTAIFLFCTLLIAGCTGRGVEAQATPAPEATPTATTDIRSGIQTGDSEVNKILAGTWAFERTDADKKADDSSLSQISRHGYRRENGHRDQGTRHDPRADVPR